MDLTKLRQGQTIYIVNKRWGFVGQVFIRQVYRTREYREFGGIAVEGTYRLIFDAHKPVSKEEDYTCITVFDEDEQNTRTNWMGITRTRNQAIRWAREGLQQALAEGTLIVIEDGNLDRVMQPEDHMYELDSIDVV